MDINYNPDNPWNWGLSSERISWRERMCRVFLSGWALPLIPTFSLGADLLQIPPTTTDPSRIVEEEGVNWILGVETCLL
jgi:hypothetical protein